MQRFPHFLSSLLPSCFSNFFLYLFIPKKYLLVLFIKQLNSNNLLIIYALKNLAVILKTKSKEKKYFISFLNNHSYYCLAPYNISNPGIILTIITPIFCCTLIFLLVIALYHSTVKNLYFTNI